MRLFASMARERKRKLQFAAVGITVMLFSFVQLWIMIGLLGMSAWLAYAIQTVVSVELNFIGNWLITYKDRKEENSTWKMLVMFHVTRIVTIPFNQLLFTFQVQWAGVWNWTLGVPWISFAFGNDTPYLIAQAVCIVATTVINYIAGDKLAFGGRWVKKAQAPTNLQLSVPLQLPEDRPSVSIVIPVKRNPVLETLIALSRQHYMPSEVILVGDIDDPALANVHTLTLPYLLRTIEVRVVTPGRDANAKRKEGLKASVGSIVAVLDSDVLPPPEWLSTVVSHLSVGGHSAVAGPLRGLGDSWWDAYIDHNRIGSKTPRIDTPYTVHKGNTHIHKLPVTANFACRREVIEHVGFPDTRFTNSYEDYSWFAMIVEGGYSIFCDPALETPRHHRSGLRSLMREYARSGKGCADFLVLFPQSRFAGKRMVQVIGTLALLLGLPVAAWIEPTLLLAPLSVLLVTMLINVASTRHIRGLLYPFVSFLLALQFMRGVLTRFMRKRFTHPADSYIVSRRETPEPPVTWPSVSVVVPVKERHATIRVLVDSLLAQDYPGNIEIILVGDVNDSTWEPVMPLIREGRIRAIESVVESNGRDANAKRNIGLEHATGDVLVLTDSDVVPPSQWLRQGVKLMHETGYEVVAGSLISIEANADGPTGLWATYTDANPIGSKTPRMSPAYVLTPHNNGRDNKKPPITANMFFTRAVWEVTGGLDANFVTPYEDYPFADTIIANGYSIYCTDALAVSHYHREGLKSLTKEYLQAGSGCTDYILDYPSSLFAAKRLTQAVLMTMGMILGAAGLVLWPAYVAIGGVAGLGALSGICVRKTNRKSAWVFSIVTTWLSLVFVTGMAIRGVSRFLTPRPSTTIIETRPLPAATQEMEEDRV